MTKRNLVCDRSEDTFIVECPTVEDAKKLSSTIGSDWNEDFSVEYRKTGDLLGCFPCRNTVCLWFYINGDDEHDTRFGKIREFIETRV